MSNISFVLKAIENWKVELAANGQISAEVKIQRDIFQENSFLSIIFVTAMIPLNYIYLVNTQEATILQKKKRKKRYPQLMYKDEIKKLKNEIKIHFLISFFNFFIFKNDYIKYKNLQLGYKNRIWH